MDKSTKAMNVRQKLTQARLEFLDSRIEKSGKNMHLQFRYFELEDIVPTATRIFARVGLVSFTDFNGETATMTVLNTDNLDEPGITFTLPYRENKPIVSNQGKEVTNPMQALGASTTYLRRYLWMMVLDITEPDEVDANLGAGTDTAPPKSKPPATPEERQSTKQKLTGADGPADALQITALKTACKELMGLDETQEEFVQQIAMKTNGFTEITRSACEQLVTHLCDMINAYGTKEG